MVFYDAVALLPSDERAGLDPDDTKEGEPARPASTRTPTASSSRCPGTAL